jgi:hypothetical protein
MNTTDSLSGCYESLSSKTFLVGETNLIVGCKSSGKTQFIINKIYRDICDNIDTLFVLSHNKTNYLQITDKVYDVDKLDFVIKYISDEFENKKQHNTLLIVETLSTNKILDKLLMLIINSKHMNLTIVVDVQMLSGINENIRSNFSNIIVANNDDKHHKRKLWRLYFGMYNKFTLFDECYSKLTDFEFMTKSYKNIYKNKTILHDTHKKMNTVIIDFKQDPTLEVKNEIKQLEYDVNNAIDLLVNLRNRLKKINC